MRHENGLPKLKISYLTFTMQTHLYTVDGYLIHTFRHSPEDANQLREWLKPIIEKHNTGKDLWIETNENLKEISTSLRNFLNTEIELHREPTKAEIKFGEGAIHYKTFTRNQVGFNKDGKLKRWFVNLDDGLRYYRSL